jgi:hypothetical protein
MTIRVNIGRKTARNKGNGMIMNITRRRKSLRGGKSIWMCGKDSLEVRMHRGCINGLNRMELRNNIRVAFLEDIFHAMGTNGTYHLIEVHLLCPYLQRTSQPYTTLLGMILGAKFRSWANFTSFFPKKDSLF